MPCFNGLVTDVSPRPAGRRARASSEGTRERIVQAAIELFAERSFEGASTRELAARARVAQPLLQYHFQSKDDLWRAAVDRIFDQLTRAMSERLASIDDPTSTAFAKVMIREFITFSSRNPQLHRIITQECKTDGPRMDYVVDTHVRPIYEQAVRMFDRLVLAGDVPPIPSAHLYYILTGAGPTLFVLGPECRRLTGLDPTDDDVIEAHVDAVCRLLFGEP